MRMNTSIPMQGQMPDLVNALARGHTAGRSRREADLYNEHGAGIAAGNQDSMNALAQFDPRLALGAQGARQDMSAQSQRMQALTAQQQRAGTLFDQGQQDRQAASKAEAAYKQTENAINVINSAQSPEQWDQFARIYGSPELVGQFGNKAALLAKLLPVKDQLAMQIEAERANAPDYTVVDGQYFDQNNPGGGAQPVPGLTAEPQGPLSAPGKLMADLQAGRITPEQFNAANQKTGMRIVSDGQGGFTVEQGPGVTGGDNTPSNPSSPAAMISSIDGILNDPALETATGVLSLLQAVPGTPQYRFGTRVRQLQGQAFLQAFESLKGAGQITEIEGTKATEAIGRLDSAQSPQDYRAALTELKDILMAASGRPPGWAEQQSSQQSETPQVSGPEDYDALPSGTRFIAPDGTTRVKP